MDTIVLASNNKHKIKEFQEILKGFKILSLNDINYFDDIVEDGETLLENAMIKAKIVHDYLKDNNICYDVISDDSGLFVPSLNGEPGVYSARYAGNHDDQKNRDKLREKLVDKERTAYFACQIVYYSYNGDIFECEGRVYGNIIDTELGKKDFGYDCIFFSDELNKTFGEATNEEKNSVSHRNRAIKKLVAYLKNK